MTLDGIRLMIKSTPEVVYSLFPTYGPDPTWRVLDKAGHIHAWIGNDLPSLIEKIDEEGDDEHPDVTHYECRLCSEIIEPKLIEEDSRMPITLQGRVQYILETDKGEWIIKEEDYKEICDIFARRRKDAKLLEDAVEKATKRGFEETSL